MPEAYHFPPFAICFFASLIGFPHAVHLVTSKYCNWAHRLLAQRTISDLPQASHLSAPANVWPLQYGQTTVNDLPHPAHRTSPRTIGLKHIGHWYPNGLLFAHLTQNLLSLSIISPQWIHGCLYVAICVPLCSRLPVFIYFSLALIVREKPK
jgi:hypothetical protein